VPKLSSPIAPVWTLWPMLQSQQMRQCVKAAVSATNVPFAGLQRVEHALSRPPQGSYLNAADPSVRGHQ